MAVVAPSESFGSFVQPYITEAMRKQQDAIEEMCSPSVPFGQIHYKK